MRLHALTAKAIADVEMACSLEPEEGPLRDAQLFRHFIRGDPTPAITPHSSPACSEDSTLGTGSEIAIRSVPVFRADRKSFGIRNRNIRRDPNPALLKTHGLAVWLGWAFPKTSKPNPKFCRFRPGQAVGLTHEKNS